MTYTTATPLSGHSRWLFCSQDVKGAVDALQTTWHEATQGKSAKTCIGEISEHAPELLDQSQTLVRYLCEVSETTAGSKSGKSGAQSRNVGDLGGKYFGKLGNLFPKTQATTQSMKAFKTDPSPLLDSAKAFETEIRRVVQTQLDNAKISFFKERKDFIEVWPTHRASFDKDHFNQLDNLNEQSDAAQQVLDHITRLTKELNKTIKLSSILDKSTGPEVSEAACEVSESTEQPDHAAHFAKVHRDKLLNTCDTLESALRWRCKSAEKMAQARSIMTIFLRNAEGDVSDAQKRLDPMIAALIRQGTSEAPTATMTIADDDAPEA